MQRVVLCYLPVLHEGYRLLLSENQPIATLGLLDGTWLQSEFAELVYLRKDIRCLPVMAAQKAVRAWQMSGQVEIITSKAELLRVADAADQIVLTDDDIGHQVATLLPNDKIAYAPIFLRWDRTKASANNQNSNIKTSTQLPSALQQALSVAGHSSDWWRHVGAVLITQSGEALTAFNQHLPNSQTPYALGDVRALFKQGEYIEMTTAIHSECAVIAQAARRGLSVTGASLFATDFPCPYCARLIAQSGIAEVSYIEKYAVIDGAQVMQDAGIKLIHYQPTPNQPSTQYVNSHTKKYPNK